MSQPTHLSNPEAMNMRLTEIKLTAASIGLDRMTSNNISTDTRTSKLEQLTTKEVEIFEELIRRIVALEKSIEELSK